MGKLTTVQIGEEIYLQRWVNRRRPYKTNPVAANKRVQSDATPRSGIGAKMGYVTHFE